MREQKLSANAILDSLPSKTQKRNRNFSLTRHAKWARTFSNKRYSNVCNVVHVFAMRPNKGLNFAQCIIIYIYFIFFKIHKLLCLLRQFPPSGGIQALGLMIMRFVNSKTSPPKVNICLMKMSSIVYVFKKRFWVFSCAGIAV